MSYNAFFAIFLLMTICMYLMLLNGKVSVRQGQKKILLVFLVLGSSILVLNKPIEVKDTVGYLEVFQSNSTLSYLISNYDIRYGNRYMGLDVGFLVYMFFIKSIGISFRGFTFINSILSLSLFIVGIYNITKEIQRNRNADILRIAMLVMIMYGVHYSAIALRGGLSIGFGLCAVAESLKKKKKIWLIILLLILSMFVQSMGVLNLFPIVFCIKNIGISKKNSIIILILMFFWFMLNMGSIVTPSIARFLLNFFSRSTIVGFSTKLKDADYRVGLRDWLMWMVSFILIYFSEDKNDHQKCLKTIMLCGIAMLCVGYPFRAFSRVVDYLFIYSVPIIYMNMEEYRVMSIRRLATMLSVLGLFAIQAVSVY